MFFKLGAEELGKRPVCVLNHHFILPGEEKGEGSTSHSLWGQTAMAIWRSALETMGKLLMHSLVLLISPMDAII